MSEPPRLESLDEIRAATWVELRRAVNDRHHAWRTPVLATVREGHATARTVVLREVDTNRGTLTVYSDSRAGKVQELRELPCAELLFWSKRLGWQLRCKVKCDVHIDDEAVEQRWARVRTSASASDYLSALRPGQPVESQHQDAGDATSAQRPFFAVIDAHVEEIDWLELDRRGHRRAIFCSDLQNWLQP